MKTKIAENIKNFRKEHSYTQEQLAEALGVTVGAVYKWEAGLSVPEIRLLMELADLFEVSMDVLLGYEPRSGSLAAMIERIERHRNEKDLENALVEAEKALKKYPSNFKLVYESALTYQAKFVEDREEKALDKSTELYWQAVSLLYQNDDPAISEVAILNSIAQNHIMCGETEQALEILKQNNVGGINNSMIGVVYASVLNKPKEAMPYLVQSYTGSLSELLRTMIAFTNVYTELKEMKMVKESLLWLIGLMDSVKIEKDAIAYTDRIKAALLAYLAIAEASLKVPDRAQQYLKEAYVLANKFDTSPVYTLQGIRFCEGDIINTAVYDDLGKMAQPAIENILYDETENGEAYQFVRKVWEELKNEKES